MKLKKLMLIGVVVGFLGLGAFSSIKNQINVNNAKQEVNVLIAEMKNMSASQQNQIISQHQDLDQKLGFTHHDTNFGWWEGHWWGVRVVVNNNYLSDIAGGTLEFSAMLGESGLADVYPINVIVISADALVMAASVTAYADSCANGNCPIGFRFTWAPPFFTGYSKQ